MKKLYFAGIFLLFFNTFLYSQGTGCPEITASPDLVLPCTQTCTDISAQVFEVGETNTYTVGSIPYTPPIAYNAPGGTGVSVNTDDVWSNVINLPFPFCFFGQTYTSAIIGSNGAIGFNTASAGGYHPWPFSASVPSTALTSAGNIFGPYHDIDPSVSGSVRWYLTGQAPCRTFIVVYQNLGYYSCTSLRTNHMMVLYETTNIIEVYVDTKPTCNSWNSGNTVIGIQNAAGTAGYTPPGRNTGPWTLTTPEAWQFVPDGAPIYSPIQWFQGATPIGTGATLNVCPPAGGATYTARTTYTRCDGLQINVEDDVHIEYDAVDVIASPQNINTCAGGSAMLSATASSTGLNFQWFNHSGGSLGSGTVSGANSSIVITAPGTPGTYNYVVQVTSPSTGCTDRDTVTVSIAPPTTQVCNVIYVSTTGSAAAAGTQANPTSLAEALVRGACNGAVVKMATGTYNINNALTIPSYITLEGGFQQGSAWDKTSLAGATTINRTTANPEGAANARRLVAFYANSADGFRLQDLTITTANANQSGMSTYGIHLTNCSNYEIVRTQVLSGNGGNGNPGVNGSAGSAGNTGGYGGAGRDRCNGGCDSGGGGGGGGGGGVAGAGGGGAPGGTNGGAGGRGGNGANDCSTNAQAGTGTSCAAGGARGANSSSTTVGGAGSNCNIVGAAGANGTNGTATYGAFFTPANGTNGTAGQGGRGGGGGGGGGENTDGCNASGNGGSGGGGGGGGGGAGSFGTGGGASFSIYTVSNGGGAQIVDSRLSAGTAGAAGNGGNGGNGGAGGAGGAQQNSCSGCGRVNRGGRGGNGSAGGNGGNGGNGSAGVAVGFRLNGTTPTIINNFSSSSLSAGNNNPPIFNLPAQPTIQMDDISCTATNIGFSAGSSNNWNFGAGSSPTTATGASINTQYSTLGRKNITYASNSYVGFANIILDSQVGPTFTTSAPFVQGQYRVCAGSSVIFTATNGGTGYIYNWNLGGGASPNTYTGTSFSSVSGTFNTPGVYTIELYYVTNCCGASITTTLDLYVEEQPNAVMPSDETICLGDNTGVPLTVTGGVTNGSISWYPSTGLNNTNQYSVVALPTTTTTYTVTLADSTGICTDVDDVTITVVDLVLTPSSSNVICNQDGTASVNVSGGSGSYSYLWSNGQTTSSITNLYAGTYQVLVTDLTLGCQDSIDVTVSPAPTAINGSMYQEDILCYGVGLGTAAISITGGTSPYTYDWSHLAPTSPTNNLSDTAYNLTAGTYTILVTDDNGCTFYDSVIITEPNPINIVIDSLLMPTCHENNDGYVEIRADGGTRPFTYSWSNGMAVTVINDEVIGTNMPADSLYLFVEDDNGCIDSLLVDLHVDSLYGTIDTTVCYNTNLTLPDGSNLTLVNDTNVIVTITNGSGCDSTITVNITVDEYTVENIDTTICQGQSLTVNGTTYNANGFYQDTARYVISGCDSIQYNINLHIDSFTVENIDTTICQGQSLTVNGTTYTANGFYQDTARYLVSGCDSIQYNINLHIDSFTVENIDTTICQGQSLTVNGTTYTANGFYQDTARYVASGCDSIQYNINLHIDSFTVENIDTTICQGQSLTVNGTTYTANGFYQDTARYVASGCDSIQYNINLHIDSFTVENIDTTICQGQSLTVNGTTYTANGFYQDTARYVVSGCDSIQYNINLHIDSFIVENIDTTICQGQTLTVNGTSYTANGFYQDTARYVVSGCDSIQYNINLHIDSFTIENIDTTICQGQSLTVNGTTYTANGFYQDTARYTVSNCDSIQYNINLHIDSFIVENIDTTICQGQSLTVNGTTYTANGFYQDTARYVISGCDSIQYNINLHIDSFTVENIDTTICQGQTLTVNGVTYTANGFYQDTARYVVSGCDSIQYNINLHIDSFIVENIDTTICQGQTLTVNGVTYTANGFYQDTARYVVSGCDSIQYNINLHIDSFIVENIDTTICQGQTLTVNGTSYTANGFYQDTTRYVVSGCDSIQYNINLHIDSFTVENIDTTICQGQSITVNGVTYTANGFYQDTARYTVSNCDSIQYNINLHIDSFIVENIDTTICQGQSLTVNGTTYTTNGFYQDTARYVVSDCDSIQYNINLHIDSFTVENIDTTICQGQSLTVNGVTYNANGFYQDTARYIVSGCDSIQYNINLHIDSFTVENIDTTICQGQSLTVNGTTYTANGFYQDTARYVVSGCDSIQYNINLHIDSFIVENIDTTICQGQSLTVNGTTYTANGFYQDTARYVISGCDSIQYNINLHIDSFIVENIDTTICQGQTLTVNGTTYTANGFYQDTARYTVSNCDSIQYNINLHIDSFIVENIDTTICQGQSLTVNGTTYTANGFYQDTARYVISGCDSIQYNINLHIDSFTVENIDTTICQGQTLTVNGVTYTANGFYQDTARYVVSGCDSIQYNINLHIDSFIVENIDTTICQGQTLTVNGVTYTANGFYQDTARYVVSGCDSIQYNINLHIDSFIVENIDTTICQGQTLTVNGTSYTANGFYQDTTRYVVSGCDSIQYNINLHIDSFTVENIDTTICQGQSITVNGVTYTANGFYQDTARYTVSNCDSIQYNINLHIDSFIVENIDTTICQGQSLTVNGTTYTTNGFYQDTARYVVSDCDSIQYNINLHIDSFTVENIDTTICQGQSLTVNGVTYNANGFYQDTARYIVSGCDSIQYNINLHIDSFTVENIDTTICQGQSLTVNGTTYTANGFYQDTARYVVSGCDSIQYNINLHIDSFIVENIDTTICQGQSLTVNGTTYTANGFYQDTARYVISGCDSIQYNINLHIDSFIVENIDATICQGQTLIVNGTTYNVNGFYQDTARYVVSGCDSIQYNINLHIDSFTVENIDTTICQGQSLTVNGTTYTTNGFYQDTARYVISGCDSIQYNINLHIDSFTVENIDTTICQGQSLTVNGTTYNANGFYQDTARYAVSNCDSIQYNINLHIDSFTVENIDTTICQGQSLTVNGTTYTTNGFYQDTARYVISGCDSIQYNINLHIDSFTVENIDTTICQGQSLTVNGTTYNANGFYQDTARYVVSGCDSIQYNINLHIDSFTVENIDTTICQGQSLTVNGTTYTANGFYQDTARYVVSGCDSIQYNINLHIDSFTVENIDTTICQSQSLTVNGVTYNANGFYQDTARYVVSGCDSIQYNINLHIDSFTVENIDTTICQGQSLTVNGTTYTINGFYQDTARYTASGCDSVQFNINLHIDSIEPITLNDTICEGDIYTLNGINYTQSGTYYDTLYHTASGCDSIHYTLNLQRLDFVTDTIRQTICEGDSYIFNGNSYTTEGVYYDSTDYSYYACDSVHYVIFVDVDSVELITIPTSICEGDTFSFNGTDYTTQNTYYDTLRYTSSGCDSVWYEIQLTVNPLPNVLATATPNDSVCENNQVTLNASGATQYSWNNSTVQTGIPFYPAVGTTQYVLTGIDANNCMNTDTINIVGLETAQTTVSYTICEDEFHTLPDGTQVNTAGTYTTTIPRVGTGCDSTITTELTVNYLGRYDTLQDVSVCSGFSQTLNVNPQNMVSIEWFVNNGSGDVSLVGNADYVGANTGELSFNLDTSLHQNTYTAQMTDECGNTYNTSMTLEVFAPHAVENPLPDTTFCMHEIDIVSVDYNGYDYEWNTGEIGRSIYPDYSGEYIVNFTENYTNCLMSDTINITLEDCIGNCVVLAPTGFSPDGSGTNDIFRVVTSCDEGFDAFSFSVYNRWGELIYYTDNWREGWDGTYKGRDAEIGVYTYYVEYTKSVSQEKGSIKGNVTLVR